MMTFRNLSRSATGAVLGVCLLALATFRVVADAETPPRKEAGNDTATIADDESPNKTAGSQNDQAAESEPAPPTTGFGAGGVLGNTGGGFGIAGGLPNRPRYVTSQNVAVTWSKSGDTVWGYSQFKGRWAKLNITPPKKGIVPTVTASVIALSTDNRVYAFSNQTARWDVLKSKGTPEVWPDRVIVEENGLFHIFSDATGRWASQSEAVEATEAEPEVAEREDEPDLKSSPPAKEGSPKKSQSADFYQKYYGQWTGKPPKGMPGQSKSGGFGAAIGSSGGGFGGSGGGVGGFGGSGGGDRITITGPWTILPPSAIPSKHYIETQEAIVAWSEAKDTLWGYSDSLRKWKKLTIVPPKRPLAPLVGFSVVAVQADDRTYAYSAKTGTWDELKTTVPPTIQMHRIVIEDKDKTYIFTAADGRWMSPNDSLEADNADTKAGSGPDSGGALAGRGFGGMARMTGASDGESPGDAELRLQGFSARGVVEDLRKAYDQTDREITQAVAEYAKTRNRLAGDDPAVVQLKTRIESLVEKAFTFRQQAQATEAEILRHRLKQVDARLAERARLKEQITQRRLQDLLNPSLEWEPPTSK